MMRVMGYSFVKREKMLRFNVVIRNCSFVNVIKSCIFAYYKIFWHC